MSIRNAESIQNYIKNKKIIFSGWNVLRKDDNPYQNWYLPMKDLFGRVIPFDTASNYFKYGKEEMNRMLLNLIKRERPDYIIFLLIYDEIDTMLFKEINKISQNTIILNIFTDDDWRYEDFSRIYALLIDYPIVNITDENMDNPYKNDGIKHLSLSLGMNCRLFKPLKVKKVYDVTFIGRPNKSRIEYIKYLLEQGIKVNVWGDGWGLYPELSNAYVGKADSQEIVKIINKSRINLNFTQGGYGKMQMKGRIFEASASKAFSLVEYFDVYKKYFKEGKELIMFKDRHELIKKIKYYLKNEKKREDISRASYKRAIKDYNKHKEILNYFNNIRKNENEILKRDKLKLKGKVFEIDLGKNPDIDYIISMADKADYISFRGKGIQHPMKRDIQAYSLEKSGKEISCCDYYVSKGMLKNMLLFKAKLASISLDEESFRKCIFLEQLMIKKEFFLKNIDKFLNTTETGSVQFLNKDNTAFVSVPLLKINTLPRIQYDEFKKAFQMKFLDKLYSLYCQKRIFFNYYPYFLIILSLLNSLLRKAIIENITNSRKMSLLKNI